MYGTSNWARRASCQHHKFNGVNLHTDILEHKGRPARVPKSPTCVRHFTRNDIILPTRKKKKRVLSYV